MNLQLEYNALLNAIPESWKLGMNDNSMQTETSQDIITETGALNKLSSTSIRGFFAKKNNHEIYAVRFWKWKFNVNIEEYFTLGSEYTKEPEFDFSTSNLFKILPYKHIVEENGHNDLKPMPIVHRDRLY